jgi:hypothetical protein
MCAWLRDSSKGVFGAPDRRTEVVAIRTQIHVMDPVSNWLVWTIIYTCCCGSIETSPKHGRRGKPRVDGDGQGWQRCRTACRGRTERFPVALADRRPPRIGFDPRRHDARPFAGELCPILVTRPMVPTAPLLTPTFSEDARGFFVVVLVCRRGLSKKSKKGMTSFGL